MQGARIFFPEERWQEFNKNYAHTGSWHDKRGDENGRSDAESRAIRALHLPGKPLVLFNIWDAGSAKAVRRECAKAIATSSWSVANANGSRWRTDLANLAIENLRRIVGATDLPVTIDLKRLW